MHTRRKRVSTIIGAAVAATLLASCGYAYTRDADQRTTTSFRMNGEVVGTEVGEVEYYFEYGTHPLYGSQTPTKTMDITVPDVGQPVSETLTGLSPDTAVQYRLCAYTVGLQVRCGQPTQTGTRGERDEVDGTGFVIDDPVSGLKIGGTVGATATYDPEYGYGAVSLFPGPGSMANGVYAELICFAVDGNRAAVGFRAWDSVGPHPMVLFIEDNGPTGDRWGLAEVPSDPTTCPTPTADDFPDLQVGDETISPVITSGDFAIQDWP